MTEHKNNKKLAKYKDRVHEFLEKWRYNDTSKEKHTHLAYGGSFQGRFVLDKENYKKFMELYIDAINKGVDDFSILEVQKEYAPIIIDIDLELPNENYNGNRLYTNEMILNVINKFLDAINIYISLDTHEYNICVFEKEKPTAKEGVYKDGFHIIFPDLCIEAKIRHLIRNTVVQMCNDNIFDGFLNGPDKIIDKAVVSTNGWFYKLFVF